MLQQIRDSITGWIATVVLMLLVIPFAFWGVDSYFAGGSANWAAKVDGVEISTSDLTQEYQSRLGRLQQLWGEAFDESIIDQTELRQSALDALINDALLTEQTISEGYAISDQRLIERIHAMPGFQVGGEFDADAYERLIRTQSPWGTPARFEDALRQNMAKEQLRAAIAGSAFALGRDARRSQALRAQQRVITFVRFSTASFIPEVAATAEEVADYYAAHTDDYLSDETVDIAYVMISPEDMRQDVDFTEADLRAYYMDRADQELAPERRLVRHLLIAADQDGLATAQATVEELKARVEAGEDFATLAAEYSDDAGSSPDGGSLGWVEPEMLPGAFGDAVFSMAAGELRGPVASEFGAHLIEVQQIEAPTVLPFEEVRDSIAAEYRAYLADQRYYDVRERMAELSFQTPGSLDPLADALGLQINYYNGLTRNGGDLGLTLDPTVIDAAFQTRIAVDGENSDPLELADQSVVVLRVSNHLPAMPKALDEVREQVRQDIIGERAAAAAQAESERVAAALAAGEDVASASDGTLGALTRDLVITRAGEGLSQRLVRAAFAAPRPVGDTHWAGSVELSDGYAALLVTRVIDADMEAVDAAALTSRRGQMASSAGSSEFNTYVDDLRAAADVSVRPEAVEQP